MKEENPSAGSELVKCISSIKCTLDKPYGEKQEQAEFDPLDLQKDIPDKKKSDGLNFLNKKKQNGNAADDLLGLDVQASPQPPTNSNPQPAKPAKANGLNFLNKKQQSTKPAPSQSNDLLDLDFGSDSVHKPQTSSATLKSTAGGSASLDLFDLSVQGSTGVQYGTAGQTNSHTQLTAGYGDLLDLGSMCIQTDSQQAQPAKKKEPTKDDLFDFGL